MAISVPDFLRLTLSEIRVARAGDVPSPDDMGDALLMFNELLDALNVDGRALFNRSFATFTLVPSLQPHTIGVAANTPTFAVSTARPARILMANVVIANNIRIPIRILDEEEWGDIRAGAAAGQAPTILSSIPRALYYSADWPNGSIYIWPVETTAYGLELLTETLLASVASADTLDLPMGYQLALRLTLAESIANMWGQAVPASLPPRAAKARGAVWGNNDVLPNLKTRDAGMPGGPRGGSYDYLTGMVN